MRHEATNSIGLAPDTHRWIVRLFVPSLFGSHRLSIVPNQSRSSKSGQQVEFANDLYVATTPSRYELIAYRSADITETRSSAWAAGQLYAADNCARWLLNQLHRHECA